jgi:lysozyme
MQAAFSEAIAATARIARPFEGLRLRPYLCPAGVPTIGYGATFYEDGTHVTLFDPPITKERAEALLLWHIESRFLPAVLRLCPVPMTTGQLAAITDFAFNLGVGNLKASTMRRYILAGDWERVAVELAKWTRGGGKVLSGLVKRRQADISSLFAT